MPLKMETDISDDVVILYCAGRLVFGDETAAFRERIRNILLGTRHIVINLSRIDYVDSGGLGTLVQPWPQPAKNRVKSNWSARTSA